MLGAMRPRAAPIYEASAIRGLGFRVYGRSRIVRNAKSLPSTRKEGIQQSGLSMDHRRLWSLAIAKASFAQLIKKKKKQIIQWSLRSMPVDVAPLAPSPLHLRNLELHDKKTIFK